MGRFDRAVVRRAAGGVVVRRGTHTTDVLVVHRPRFDDWALPKGHVDDGESWAETAVREVLEETGAAAHITGEPEIVGYVLPDSAPLDPVVKLVVFYPMAVDDHESPLLPPDPDEVDVVEWWPFERCRLDLTYAADRDVVGVLAANG